MLVLYGIPNCNTVKKARVWLTDNGIEYQFHDYKKAGITDSKIKTWLLQYPWEKLINKSGTTWRGLSDVEKESVQDEASATALMIAITSIIKRPIIEDSNGKIYALGFDEALYKEVFL
jgi:arsenate reductase